MTKSFIASLGLIALLAVPAQSEEVFDLNFQMTYAGPHVLNLQFYEPWAKSMKEKSGGTIDIHTAMSGAIFRAEEAVPTLMNGTIDITGYMTTYGDTQFPHTQVLNMPYISPDSVHASAMYWKAYTTMPEVAKELDAVGKVLTIWGSDRSGIFSTKGPILSPADIRGKRVLIWAGGQVDQVKAWGGIPVQVAGNDTYMALQRGMGDVFYGPLPTGVAYKLMEVAKDITIFPASTFILTLSMNWDVWNEFSPAQQELVMSEMGEGASIKCGQLLYDATNRDLDTMRGVGCTIHEISQEQIQKFRDADARVITEFWLNDLKRLGNPDPEGAIRQAYALSDSITVRGGQ